MLSFIALLTGDRVYTVWSYVITKILRSKGMQIGSGFRIHGVPKIKIRGIASNIIVGNDVRIHGSVDLRNRGNAKIILEDGVYLDHDVRLVAANNAVIRVGRRAEIGKGCIVNAGADVTIGSGAMIAGYCYIQSSSHGMKKSMPIKEQAHSYGKIRIGADAWLGGHVSVLEGVALGEGCVVGAKSVVTKNVEEYSIVAGVPAKKIGKRP